MLVGKKIIIYNNTSYCGGTLALSCLCKTLRELGYDASLYLYPTDSIEINDCRKLFRVIRGFHFRTIIRRYVDRYLPCLRFWQSYKLPVQNPLTMDKISFYSSYRINPEKTIVIYPEIVKGNPLMAKNVVRWLLYHYPYANDNNAFSKSDLFIAYRRVFNNLKLNPDNNIVKVKYFNSNLYRQNNFSKREGTCYVIYKGRKRNDLPSKYDGPVYDNNMSQEEIVEMFNSHKYCYFYDMQTFYSTIAAVCGCIPILVPEKDKTLSDYRTSDEPLLGCAFGDSPEQIQYAIDTRNDLLKTLDFDTKNKENVRNLVEILQKHFGDIKRV